MVGKVRSKASARASALAAVLWKPGFVAAVLVLAFLALPLAALLSATAQAQTAEVTSVSNLSQSNASGNAGVGWFTASTRTAQAQQFTTSGGDYTLKSVEVSLRRVGTQATVRVSIYTSTSGNKPGTSLYVLTNPASIFSHTNTTFTAPANATLDPNTSYFVVFENTASDIR